MKKKSIFELIAFCFISVFIMSCEPIKESDNTDTTAGNQSSPITDTEGNSYKTVTIGTQVWMTENLKTTKFNDGTTIPLVTDGYAWSNLKGPGYCWYDNDAAKNKNTYGALYNWYTANTGKLCPTGWRVPSNADLITFMTYLGDANTASAKLKETGTSHWPSPNPDATNSTGFTAIPGGYRFNDGLYYYMNGSGDWWSSTESTSANAWYLVLSYTSSMLVKSTSEKQFGYAVRCVKN
ncbi:MAG: fibrobacter succinogenes major paralogous domain-containing protein [Prolixibacteraceae bacterium]